MFLQLDFGCGALGWVFVCVERLGVSWGTRATHKLPQETLIKMRKDNRNKKVKLFDAEKSTICADWV
jgi:hypothetical protein